MWYSQAPNIWRLAPATPRHPAPGTPAPAAPQHPAPGTSAHQFIVIIVSIIPETRWSVHRRFLVITQSSLAITPQPSLWSRVSPIFWRPPWSLNATILRPSGRGPFSGITAPPSDQHTFFCSVPRFLWSLPAFVPACATRVCTRPRA